MGVVKQLSQSVVPSIVCLAASVLLVADVLMDIKFSDFLAGSKAYATVRQNISLKEASYLPPEEAQSQLRDKDGLINLLNSDGGRTVFNALRRRAPEHTEIVLEKVRLDNANLSGINKSGEFHC